MFSRLTAGFGLALAQLRYERTRTVLAILGIAFAVLSATLLAGIGFGVIETGEEKFTSSNRDLWLSGGPVRLAPGTLGGFETTLYDAHTVSREIANREDVSTAPPMLFQTVYVGTNSSNLQTHVAVGVPSTTGGVEITRGRGFPESTHYANGTYSGDRIRELLVDPQTAAQYNLSVGDRLHIGGTVMGARDTTYRVVGISPTMSTFLGVPVVVVPLAELQSMTGKAHADQATMITVKLNDGADSEAVEQDLQAAYPRYDVRTNQEQLQAVLAKQAVVIASGFSLVVAAVIAGLALTVNLLSLLIYQQRHAIAAVRALGVSRTVIVSMVGGQALLLGLAGGSLGLIFTPPLAAIVELIASMVIGFDGLVRTPYPVYLVGVTTAIGIGTISAILAGIRVAGLDVLDVLNNRE